MDVKLAAAAPGAAKHGVSASDVEERSLKARQTMPTENTLSLGDEFHAKSAAISREYPSRSVITPTERGFNSNYYVGVRKATSGESALGDNVRACEYGVKALPPVRYTDNDSRLIQEQQLRREFSKRAQAMTDLKSSTEYQEQSVTIVKGSGSEKM
jgi:hypothetical protein